MVRFFLSHYQTLLCCRAPVLLLVLLLANGSSSALLSGAADHRDEVKAAGEQEVIARGKKLINSIQNLVDILTIPITTNPSLCEMKKKVIVKQKQQKRRSRHQNLPFQSLLSH